MASFETRLINAAVIPEAAKRLFGSQPRAPSVPLGSGFAAPERREAPIRVPRPGTTAN
ncbi:MULTISPECIES: hypothetical protein [Rhodoplanes]|uniref:hypothetical protein n=1 Tax=Rhodoplanes TaxID=29407 RepID=UPI0013E9E146|nr:hypothetical protein [Rhodoplanes serenus]